MTTAATEKEDKQIANRLDRRKNASLLKSEEDDSVFRKQNRRVF